MPPRIRPRCRSPTSSSLKSSFACPPQPTSSAPPPPASPSAASWPTAPSSGSSASSTPRPSSASSVRTPASTPPSRLTPPALRVCGQRHRPRRRLLLLVPSGPRPRSPLGCLGRPRRPGTPPRNAPGTETVVCDPLHRRYLMLPSIPDDLAASVEGPRPHSCEIFLVPEGGDEDDEPTTTAEETAFRVIWMGHCEDKLITYVFSSSTRQWQAIRSLTWTDLSAGSLSSTETAPFCRRQYAYGYFYWLPNSKHTIKMLVLNTRKMEFSVAEPPTEPKVCYRHITMVEAGEGRPGLVVLTYAHVATFIPFGETIMGVPANGKRIR
ncbi:proline-rich receptor-like protein kinase PERK10 isoform X1 [Triticum dicoccoides]|uniref:proline-rich receptor-like protein kinase PERK10 isoform X1 n=1 Tax=Triticum dicoccoides TaxID=85692 RepID=UPI0018906080|nr:proline-rich receptor-like protein kinase PERK10 isoform X1 [Triticum dicoccoides]